MADAERSVHIYFYTEMQLCLNVGFRLMKCEGYSEAVVCGVCNPERVGAYITVDCLTPQAGNIF